MSITFDQAVAQFLDPANTTQYSSLDAVKNLIPQISGEVFNPQTGSPSTAERLLYNGQLPDGTWASTMANTLANDGSGRYVSIFESEVGRFLNNPDVQTKIRQLCDQTGQSYDAFIGGTIDPATGIRTNGLWDTASTNYVTDTANGNFRILVDKPTLGSTFAVNEIDALVARASAGLPTTIQGMPANEILNVYTSATGANQAKNLDALGKAINAAGEITAVKTGVADVATAGMTALEKSTYLQTATKILQKAGPYAAALSALVVAGEANAAYSQGDTAKGNSIVASWAAEMGAGWAAGAAAGSAAFYATAWMNAFGPIGTAANFLISAGAGIYGGYVGGDAAANYMRTLMQETGTTTTDGNYNVTRFSNGMEYRELAPISGTGSSTDPYVLPEVVVTATRLTPPIAGTWTIPNADGSVTQIGASADNKYFTIEQKSDATPTATSVKNSTITIDAGGVHNTTFNKDGWTTVTTDPATRQITSNSSALTLADHSTVETVTYANGRIVHITTDASGNQTQEIVPTATESFVSTTATLIDAMSLIKAIQTGQPLPIVASGLRLANTLTSINGVPASYSLSGAANVAGGVLSLMSLDAALKRGDSMAAITAGAQAISYSASAYVSLSTGTANVTAQSITNAFPNAGSAINGLNTALPYLNIVNSIVHGDAVGAAMGVIAMTPAAPIAWAYYAFQMIDSLFGSTDAPPEAWGSAHAQWTGFTATSSAVGQFGGLEAASQTYNGMLTYLDQLAAQQQTLNPGSSIGVSGFTHGTGYLAANGFVHYTPEANYFWTANDAMERMVA